MKNLLTLTSSLIITVMLGAFAHAEGAKEIYEKKCAKCHGLDGDGNGRAGRSLKKAPTAFNKVSKTSDENLFKVIKSGGEAIEPKQSKEMEAYPSLKDDEIKALVTYIRSMAK